MVALKDNLTSMSKHTHSYFTIFFLTITALLTMACSNDAENKMNSDHKATLDSILNHYGLKGSILIYASDKQTYYSNNFEWAKTGFLPASTFKIPNSIIALESGVLKSDTTMLPWDKQPRSFPEWEKDLTLREAFQASCLPCFQEIAKKIGVKPMQTYLNKLHYTNMDVSASTISNFWIAGKSRITQFDQIDFLQRFYTKKLPILNSTRETMLRVMRIDYPGSAAYYGKTGWSTDADKNNGWYVGFVVKDQKPYYFALNVDPIANNQLDKFRTGRREAMEVALRYLNIL